MTKERMLARALSSYIADIPIPKINYKERIVNDIYTLANYARLMDEAEETGLFVKESKDFYEYRIAEDLKTVFKGKSLEEIKASLYGIFSSERPGMFVPLSERFPKLVYYYTNYEQLWKDADEKDLCVEESQDFYCESILSILMEYFNGWELDEVRMAFSLADF